jgi:hypothetical protein
MPARLQFILHILFVPTRESKHLLNGLGAERVSQVVIRGNHHATTVRMLVYVMRAFAFTQFETSPLQRCNPFTGGNTLQPIDHEHADGQLGTTDRRGRFQWDRLPCSRFTSSQSSTASLMFFSASS